MTVESIIEALRVPSIAALIIVIGSLIKIKPLEVNVWGWLARKIGNALNHDMMTQIKIIEQRLDNHIKEDEEEKMIEKRQLILNFAKEMLRGEKHTQEGYVEVLSIIDQYEKYCEDHPDFPNNRAILAIQSIKNNYSERLEKADFLTENYRKS